eukprot:585131-Hanusia_phi.AAC.3
MFLESCTDTFATLLVQIARFFARCAFVMGEMLEQTGPVVDTGKYFEIEHKQVSYKASWAQ